MATRSLNKVQLIGNLTRDPELRYTPQGTAVCTFGMATNRSWTTDSGEKKEEAEFHRIVAWNKLAELCAQLLFKGRRVYIEGRLQTRSWTSPEGTQRQATEVVAQDMLILDDRRAVVVEGVAEGEVKPVAAPAEMAPVVSAPVEEIPIVEVSSVDEVTGKPAAAKEEEEKDKKGKKAKGKKKEKEEGEEIPF